MTTSEIYQQITDKCVKSNGDSFGIINSEELAEYLADLEQRLDTIEENASYEATRTRLAANRGSKKAQYPEEGQEVYVIHGEASVMRTYIAIDKYLVANIDRFGWYETRVEADAMVAKISLFVKEQNI